MRKYLENLPDLLLSLIKSGIFISASFCNPNDRNCLDSHVNLDDMDVDVPNPTDDQTPTTTHNRPNAGSRIRPIHALRAHPGFLPNFNNRLVADQ